ncbi:MAG: DUF4405 domain-containing protein [Candidatus Aminicenantes bacterium]|nr:DUF4405 domain-containing protein [Candidatus Aminicenantes bacterium]
MKRTDWKYLVDTLLFICITGIAFIGFLLGFIISEGPAASGREKYFLGLHRHQWGHIHLYLSLAFILLVIIHLILSWSWIKGKARHLFKSKWSLALMLTVFVSISVPFLFWVFTPKNSPDYKGYGTKEGEITEPNRTLEESHIIPKDRIFQDEERIKMPETKDKASLDETLGILRKKYFFTMQEVRDVVSSLVEKSDK